MTILETNLPPAPDTIEPPATTPPPLEPETPPIVIRDSHPAEDGDSENADGDEKAGDEGIDDSEADDTEAAEPPENPADDHEEDLGEE